MTPHRSWSPKPAAAAIIWGLAAIALVLALLGPDPATRLLMGTATLLLAGLAAHATFLRPRLTVDDTGLTVRTITGPHHLLWHEVHVKLVHTRRLGRESTTLELDWRHGDQEQLFVLTQTDLGTDPRDVADILHALRP